MEEINIISFILPINLSGTNKQKDDKMHIKCDYIRKYQPQMTDIVINNWDFIWLIYIYLAIFVDLIDLFF